MQPSTAFAMVLLCGHRRDLVPERGSERQLLGRIQCLVADLEASVMGSARGSAGKAGVQCRFKSATDVQCRWNSTYSTVDCDALARANLDTGSLDLEAGDVQVCDVGLGCA